MEYKSGDDYKDYDEDYPTYGITCGEHTNKIEVYDDEKLRNEILDFLIASQQTSQSKKGDKMNITELKDKIVKEGIKSVNANEKEDPRRIGGVRGFLRCRELEGIENFELELHDRHLKEIKWISGGYPSEETIDVYWEYRYATLQIEYCYEILKVALRYPTVSCRAVLRYAELVGVE